MKQNTPFKTRRAGFVSNAEFNPSQSNLPKPTELLSGTFFTNRISSSLSANGIDVKARFAFVKTLGFLDCK